MPVAVAYPIAPTAAERERLKNMAYGHKTEYRLRLRAQVVLHAARGRSHARIARKTGLHLDTVRKWRGRFAELGLPGLADRKRTGRPPSFTALQAAQVKALALVFKPGIVDEFTVPFNDPHEHPDDGPAVFVRSQIARAR